MKSLVELAKELGIHPNPNLSEGEYMSVARKIGERVAEIPTGLPPDDRHERQRHLYPYDLKKVLYNTRKFMDRHWNKDDLKKVVSAMTKKKRKDIWIHSQAIGTPLDETPFIHHGSLKIESDYRERFVADINLDSPQFLKAIKELDKFIAKYCADFKITNAHTANRSDTMNVYMTQDITPKIAQELYRILKPCLNSTNHDRLDGLEIFEGSKPIKGLKVGPEINENEHETNLREVRADNAIKRDMPDGMHIIALSTTRNLTGHTSLGEKTAALQVLDLMYYLVGKEGKNPFHLESYDGKPYQKHIDINDSMTQEATKEKVSVWKRMTSLFGVTSLFGKSDKKPIYDPAKDFEDSRLWSEAMVRNAEGVCYGHRINITSFSDEERKALKDMLAKRHIQYEERRATTNNADIKAGDLTIRVSDPKSIRTLRSMVFNWAEGPHARPIFQTYAEYEADRKKREEKIKMIREKRKQPAIISKKPAWADKQYWNEVLGTEKGYVMDLGISARFGGADRSEGSPFDEEQIIKELAEKGIQAEKRASGLTNCLAAYKMTHDSLVILGDKNAEKFEQMYLQGTNATPLYAVAKDQISGR